MIIQLESDSGEILKGELSAMNTIAKQTILERKKKWLMLIYMVKMPFFLEAPLAKAGKACCSKSNGRS